MNKTVSVSGMELKTKVGANLLICDNNEESSYAEGELVQGVKALLEPVSTVSGTDGSFYYTVNAKADGDAMEDVYELYNETDELNDTNAIKTGYDLAFNKAYGIVDSATTKISEATELESPAYGYVDYTFYLKATSEKSNQYINVTKVNLTYKDAAITNESDAASGDKAWRVALFAEELTTNKGNSVTTDAVTESNDTAKTILRLAESENQTDGQAVDGKDSADGSVSYGTAANLASITEASTTHYYKVVARVWLEGEDKTCTSETYAALQDSSWKLDLEIKLEDSTGGATNITSEATT